MDGISNTKKHGNKYEQLEAIDIHVVRFKNKYTINSLHHLTWWFIAASSIVITIILVTCKIVVLPRLGIISSQLGTDWKPLHIRQNVISDKEKLVSCYYNFPSQLQFKLRQLMPSDIHPFLCTHINVGFAVIDNKELKLDDYQYSILRDIVKLKHKNPELKILLSVGGAGNDKGFSDMVVNHASRKIFIRSIKNVMRNYSLDGVDLDWEFPALHRVALMKRERQHLSQLLREIRLEFIREKRNYILTLAVAALETIVDISYDVEQINKYADYVNIMTYDFHYYTKYTPFTGLNSPLYARDAEHMYMATLNINYTVNMYIRKGLQPSKILVGIPTYGHTFTLVNAGNARIGSPASGFGSISGSGFINYPDVCLFTKNFSDVTLMFEDTAKVPYLYRNKDWMSYDNPRSVMEKANFIKDTRLRGAMIYSLNADDYDGVCAPKPTGRTKFPLLRTVKNALIT